MKIFQQVKERARWVFLAALVIYILLFGFNSLTRTRLFTPDSMNYVDVARNITSGHGIVQSTLGYNQVHFSPDDEMPVPLTSQPPLYPLLIALVTYAGIEAADAALLISITSFGVILLIMFSIVVKLYNKNIALLSVCLLLIYFPLKLVSSFAWSEPPGMVFVLLSVWILLNIDWTNKKRILFFPALAGLTVGLAFSIRYAFLPLIFVGLIYLLVKSSNWKQRVSTLISYVTGFALPFLLVIVHNYQAGNVIIPESNPPINGIGDNFIQVTLVLLGNYFHLLPEIPELILISLMIIVIFIVQTFKGKFFHTLREVLINRERYLLTLWIFSYLTFLIIVSSLRHIDPIDPRLVLPAGIMLIPLFAAFIYKTVRLKIWQLNLLGFVILILLILYEIQTTIYRPVFDVNQYVNSTERLSWIEKNTSEQDLIIGDDTMDIPFYLGRTKAVSFSPSPGPNYPTYEQIVAYVNKHLDKYKHIYLVLRNRYNNKEEWENNFGPFITDLISGQYQNYPEVKFVIRLDDGYIFELCSSEEKS